MIAVSHRPRDHPFRPFQPPKKLVGPRINCLIMGDHQSGKRCLALRARDGSFPQGEPKRSASLVHHYGCVSVPLGHRNFVDLNLQVFSHLSEGFRTAPASISCYFDLTDVVLLCCPTTDPAVDVVDAIRTRWLPFLLHYRRQFNFRVILVGTKCDRRVQNGLSTSEGERLASAIGANTYVQSSALTGLAVDQVLFEAAETRVHRLVRMSLAEDEQSRRVLSRRRRRGAEAGCSIQ